MVVVVAAATKHAEEMPLWPHRDSSIFEMNTRVHALLFEVKVVSIVSANMKLEVKCEIDLIESLFFQLKCLSSYWESKLFR